ncbi:hypothetical protein [Tuwongella immobilis]|nr:hypothetical protein [Tuwongella immobilis]
MRDAARPPGVLRRLIRGSIAVFWWILTILGMLLALAMPLIAVVGIYPGLFRLHQANLSIRDTVIFAESRAIQDAFFRKLLLQTEPLLPKEKLEIPDFLKLPTGNPRGFLDFGVSTRGDEIVAWAGRIKDRYEFGFFRMDDWLSESYRCVAAQLGMRWQEAIRATETLTQGRDAETIAALREAGKRILDQMPASPPKDPWLIDVVAVRFYLPNAEQRQIDETIWREMLGDPQRFGNDIWAMWLELGDEFRPAMNPRLQSLYPNDSEFASFIAVRDRFLGLDSVSNRVQEFETAQDQRREERRDWLTISSNNVLTPMVMGSMFCPNDDVSILAFGRGFGKPLLLAEGGWIDYLALFSLVFVGGVILQRILRKISTSLFGRMLWLGEKSLFREFERDVFHPWTNLFTMTIGLLASWWVSRTWMDPMIGVHCRSEIELMAAVVWSVLTGGLLVELIENGLVVLMIRLSFNPYRTILDNVAVILISIVVMQFFENSWIAIVSSLVIGLAGSWVHKLRAWFRS